MSIARSGPAPALVSLLGFLGLAAAACGTSPASSTLDEATDEVVPGGGAVDGAVAAGLVFDLASQGSAAVPRDVTVLPEPSRYPIGTVDTDVREMLRAVEEGRRGEIVVPERQGDLTIDVYTLQDDAADLDGDGQTDRILLRYAVVPRPGVPTVSVGWLVAVLADEDGSIGPDQVKNGVLIDAVMVESTESRPLVLAGVKGGKKRSVTYLKATADGGYERIVATPRQATVEERLQPDAARDLALVTSAMRVFDTGVLAPEMAYVKAFIHQGFMPEVEAVEGTRDLVFPEILAPLYASLKLVQARLAVPEVGQQYAEVEPRMAMMTTLLVREGDLRLGLTAEELRRRMEGLQQLGDEFGALQEALTLDGQPMRRRDFENKLAEIADADERARVTRVYQDAFRPMVAEDGRYRQFIGEMNEIARAHGYANYPDMRMVEKFGVDLAGFQAWMDEAWAATDADARAFVESLEQFAGTERLTYWQVGQLSDAWVLERVGVEAMPTLSEADAIAILKQMYRDVGFDMSQPPYDAITMDWYQDDLKWNRAGTAATATPEHAYFTSNLRPGVPIPLNEWETPVHETGHTIHYQTSGAVGQGLSSYQNMMPSYVAEGVAMTFEELAVTTPALMARYFGGKEGFTDTFIQVYPEARAQATAWQTRRLLTMAAYEVNLYVDRNEDGSTRPWSERVAAWDGMVRDRLFVEPPADSLAQIMCRSHPFDDQSMLGYGSYALGYLMVSQIRHRTIAEGTDAELQAFGAAMKELMEQGALADRQSTTDIINTL